MPTITRSRLAMTVAAAVSALALTACAAGGSPAAPAASNAAGVDLVNAGKLTVCTHLSFKPFQFKDASNKVVGFDVDMMDLVVRPRTSNSSCLPLGSW